MRRRCLRDGGAPARSRRGSRLDAAPHRRPAWLASVLVAGLLSCGGDAERPELLSVTVDTASSGTVGILVRGETPRWELEELRTLEASAEGAAGEGFASVEGLAVDRTGSIWVADGTSRQIRVYGPSGALIRLIDRPGGGAEEFGSLHSIAFLGGQVLALDPVKGRVVQLSAGGSLLGERPAHTEVPDSGSPHLGFHAVGPAEVYQRALQEGEDGTRPVWVRHGPRGVMGTRPAYEPPEPPPPSTSVCSDPSTGTARAFPLAFRPRWVQHPAPGGLLAVAWTGTYRVAFLNAEGDTARVVERERPAVPVTDTAWTRALADVTAFLEAHPDARCEPPLPDRPDVRPPLSALLVDAVGRLWVEAATAEGPVWDVYDGAGHPLGTVASPASRDTAAGPSPPMELGRTPSYINSEHVAWAWEGPEGEPRVTLARIRR